MSEDAIRTRVKEIVATAIGRAPEEVSDSVDFVEDLQLDSLVLLEIAVDIDYEFQLGLPNLEEHLKEVTNLQQAVKMVRRRVHEKAVSLQEA